MSSLLSAYVAAADAAKRTVTIRSAATFRGSCDNLGTLIRLLT
jgi:hypothetical protein